jgi:hypothetical protein
MSSALAARTMASQIGLVAIESADLPEIRAFVGRSANQVGVGTNEYRSAGRRANPVGGRRRTCDSVASAPGLVKTQACRPSPTSAARRSGVSTNIRRCEGRRTRPPHLERRQLELKGKQGATEVVSLRVA